MLRFLADEDVPGDLVAAIRRHTTLSGDPIDLIAVGQPSAPPKGTLDPDLLDWATANGRILISRDKGTMRTHLANHLAARKHSPGVLLVRRRPIMEIVLYLEDIAGAGFESDYRDLCTFIP